MRPVSSAPHGRAIVLPTIGGVDIAARLSAAGCVAPDQEAAELVAAARDPEELEALVVRRMSGEPLAWLVGSVDFCGIRVAVHPGVYVPRWQSEALARRAAALLPPAGVAVDLCTGAGAVACVLQAEAPSAVVVASDIDPRAVACALANRVHALVGDLDQPLPATLRGEVDVMTAVVPYVPTDELSFLPRDVVAYEPRPALDGGPGGLRLLSAVVRLSPRWLRPGGWLLLELGGDQAPTVAAAMTAAGFVDIAVLTDEEGDDRAIEARRPAGRVPPVVPQGDR
ncbi:MAG: release factor glutamine methyltransferase [Actinomycetota bacterium]|jgi:release factor glutamine methyltransferase|nr:release factor glutamine methyltransferase [Actinomycetota bacterium]